MRNLIRGKQNSLILCKSTKKTRSQMSPGVELTSFEF